MARNDSAPSAESEDSTHKALARYFSLQSSLRPLTNSASRSGQQDSDHANAAASAHSDLAVLSEFLSSYIPPKYYNERRQKDSTIASRVLCIPELLEMILESVDVIDVAQMSDACQTSRDIIDNSPKLQAKLSLKSCIQAAELTTPFDWTNREYYFKDFVVVFEQVVRAAHTPYWADRGLETGLNVTFKRADGPCTLPVLSSRCGRLPICQPVTCHIKIERSCPVDRVNITFEDIVGKGKRVYLDSSFILDDLLHRAREILGKNV